MHKHDSKSAHKGTWTPLPKRMLRNVRSWKSKRGSKKSSNLITLLAIFLFIVLVILILIWYYSTIYMGSPTKASQVSDRNPDGSVKRSDMIAVSKLKQVILAEKCYGLTVPYGPRKISRIGTCSVFVSLESPHGMLVVDYRETGGATISSDIMMRRSNFGKYEETKIIGRDGREFIVFKNIESMNFEKTAFLQLDGVTIGITLRTDSPSSEYEADFRKVLSSFYCVNECRQDKFSESIGE